MSKFIFHKKFIEDVCSNSDANFAKRIFQTIFQKKINHSEDHIFKSLNNAWIKKIGRGERIIYLKKDNDIIFYRCGRHEIEDVVGRTSNSNLLTEINEITNIDIIDEGCRDGFEIHFKNENRKLLDRLCCQGKVAS